MEEKPGLPEMESPFSEQETRLISSVRSGFRVFGVFRGDIRLHGPGFGTRTARACVETIFALQKSRLVVFREAYTSGGSSILVIAMR
jgi:hypothetical protein